MGASADLRRSVVVLALAVTQVTSATVMPLLGSDVGSIANALDHPLLPAGWAFTIWGLLYLTSLLAAVWQVLPAQRGRHVHRRTGWSLAVAYGMSALWVPLFVLGQAAVAEVVIIIGLVALVRAALRLTRASAHSVAERVLLRLPVTLYLGWIALATVAGLLTALRSLGLPSHTEASWIGPAAVALLVVATLGCLVLALRLTAVTGFAASSCWALAAIAVAGHTTGAQITAVVAATLILAVLVYRIARTPDRVRMLVG